MAIEKAMGADRRKARTSLRVCAGCRRQTSVTVSTKCPRSCGAVAGDFCQPQAVWDVSGRLPRWRPTPTSISAVVAASLKQLRWEDRLLVRHGRLGLRRFPQAARQHGRRPSVNHVVGQLVEIDAGQAFHSGTKDDPPTGAVSRTQPRRQRCSLESVAIELGGRKHPRPPAAGRNLLLRRRRIVSDTSSKPPPICRRQPAKTRRLVRATLRSPPIAFSMSMHVGTDRRSPRPAVDPAQVFDPTSKDGREASIVTGTCVCKAICRPIGDLSSSGRFNRRQEPATLNFPLARSASPPMQNPLPTASGCKLSRPEPCA